VRESRQTPLLILVEFSNPFLQNTEICLEPICSPQGHEGINTSGPGTKVFGAFFQILIKVEVFFQDDCYSGHLWVVSHSRACIRSFQQVPMGAPAQIRFHEPSEAEFIEARGELIWMNQLRGAHYSGLRFEEGFDIAKTFLWLLIKTDPS
jgi:hypothetical protein